MRLFLGPEELLLLPVELLLILPILLVVVVVGPPLVAVSRPIILSGIPPSPELLFEIFSLPVEVLGTPVVVFLLGPILLVIGRAPCPSRVMIAGVRVLFVSLAVISVGMLLLRRIWCMVSFPGGTAPLVGSIAAAQLSSQVVILCAFLLVAEDVIGVRDLFETFLIGIF